MLDRLFLKHLSKKGKIAYWVGQIILDVLWALYVFKLAKYTFDNGGDTVLIIGMLVILILWGGLCYILWKKPNESEDSSRS
jgi:drug/metabolite transporter superfamily protein YnfA